MHSFILSLIFCLLTAVDDLPPNIQKEWVSMDSDVQKIQLDYNAKVFARKKQSIQRMESMAKSLKGDVATAVNDKIKALRDEIEAAETQNMLATDTVAAKAAFVPATDKELADIKLASTADDSKGVQRIWEKFWGRAMAAKTVPELDLYLGEVEKVSTASGAWLVHYTTDWVGRESDAKMQKTVAVIDWMLDGDVAKGGFGVRYKQVKASDLAFACQPKYITELYFRKHKVTEAGAIKALLDSMAAQTGDDDFKTAK